MKCLKKIQLKIRNYLEKKYKKDLRDALKRKRGMAQVIKKNKRNESDEAFTAYLKQIFNEKGFLNPDDTLTPKWAEHPELGKYLLHILNIEKAFIAGFKTHNKEQLEEVKKALEAGFEASKNMEQNQS